MDGVSSQHRAGYVIVSPQNYCIQCDLLYNYFVGLITNKAVFLRKIAASIDPSYMID